MTFHLVESSGADIPWPTEPPGEDSDGSPSDGGQDKNFVSAPSPSSRSLGVLEDCSDARPVLADVLLTRSALRGLPEPAPLIHGVLDRGSVALLYGPWGSGKSFLALDWAASVATGREWQGRPVEQCRVLYVAAEGAFGLKARLDAWEIGWSRTISDGALDVLPRPVNLSRSVDVVNLIALVGWNGYGLVILDTLARCLVGADENSAKDCGLVVDVLHRIRENTPDGRGVVMAVHHTGKDKRTFRGSSVFEAGADTVYSVTSDSDDGAIVVNREKRKDGPVFDAHRLKLDPIEIAGSCVLSKSHLSETKTRSEALLSHFVSHFAGTGATAAQMRDTIELNRATFYRALNDLVKRGDLVNTGTDKRPFYKAAEK